MSSKTDALDEHLRTLAGQNHQQRNTRDGRDGKPQRGHQKEQMEVHRRDYEERM